ncbi:hypothetical protein QLX08_011342 [Tetragonisca angustula]|uniref:Uncharacterized protein n=1 Tax=Tetragonisca angustula TaxID=166442 RepID=A0AAW0Z895_9HYME
MRENNESRSEARGYRFAAQNPVTGSGASRFSNGLRTQPRVGASQWRISSRQRNDTTRCNSSPWQSHDENA